MTIDELQKQLELEQQKNKVLEETIETLKNMRLSDEMRAYLDTQQANLRAISLLNSLSAEQISVKDFQTEMERLSDQKSELDQHINDAITKSARRQRLNATPFTDFDYDLNSRSDGVRIIKYTGRGADVIIPDRIEGYPVTEIFKYAFSKSGVRSVVIPDTVTSIRSYAFFECTGLETVILPSALECIYSSAFLRCTSLKSITLPGTITALNSYAFYSTALTGVTVPETISEIKSGVFSYLQSDGQPNEIAVLGTNTVIDENAFANSDVTIYCAINSAARKFCRAHKIPTKPLSECPWLK
ncbi:MAG: leucine-rich repeat protein [Oscillospiraceae bacterium]